MHDYSIVKHLVTRLLAQLESEGSPPVTRVDVQRSSAFCEETLRDAWDALTRRTVLRNAQLVVHTADCVHTCRCGYSQLVTPEDLVEEVLVCPHCGAMDELPQAHEVGILDVVLEEGAFEFADKVLPAIHEPVS